MTGLQPAKPADEPGHFFAALTQLAEIVQGLEVILGVEKSLMLVLAVDVDQEFTRGIQHGQRDRTSVDEATVSAFGRNDAPQHHFALLTGLDSQVADLTNVTPHRWGGMLSAGLFLSEFVAEGVEWAHVDVAGPAYNDGGAEGYLPKGGTGVPVRTMLAVLEDIAAAG